MDQPITRAEHISIHALREEGDFPRYARTARRSDFYPRPPRGGRLIQSWDMAFTKSISIHALREEGDRGRPPCWPLTARFLSTPSARRATNGGTIRNKKFHQFLSTPSARRATRFSPSGQSLLTDFYPRPPRGGRRAIWVLSRLVSRISIHALREEGDAFAERSVAMPPHFYPRPPRGGRLGVDLKAIIEPDISIHALREEGDNSILEIAG